MSARVETLPRLVAIALIVAALWSIFGGPMVTRIVVSKSARVLTAFGSDGAVVATYPVIFGREGVGTKFREGDLRTPEGEYYVCFKNPKSQFHLSLGLSYPNVADAERGLAEGAITQAEYAEIIDAQRARRIPPWKTALGGEIFIHGEMNERSGTRGCVAMANQAIEVLFPQVALGTPVVIEP